MKILSLIDSFKGTLTSRELGLIMSEEAERCAIKADYMAISDGGDGFLDAIEPHIPGAARIWTEASDPLGRRIHNYFLYDDRTKTAYVEMARASGLDLLKKEEYNPRVTSTFGLGQMILKAKKTGGKSIVVGIGGSATNDGGAGMAEALGLRFYNRHNERIEHINGEGLSGIARIDARDFDKTIAGLQFTILGDVTCPLLGKDGAALMFSRQKGAADDDVLFLEGALKNYADIVEHHKTGKWRDLPGAGAAGGIGFGFYSLFNATYESGIARILHMIRFKKIMHDYDYIITGEGKLDIQSFYGKAVGEIIKQAKGKNILFVCAVNEMNEADRKKMNIEKLYSVVDFLAERDESVARPEYYFRKLCRIVIRDILKHTGEV